jgi:DNA-binding NtrC family response regulator
MASLADVQREYILAVLAANHGNRAKTAMQLAISSATLHRKLARMASRRRGLNRMSN